MKVKRVFWEHIHAQIEKLLEPDSPRELTVREVLEAKQSVLSPQSEEDESVPLLEDLSGKSPTAVTLSLTLTIFRPQVNL